MIAVKGRVDMAAEQSFDVYRLPEEHEAIREAVRERL